MKILTTALALLLLAGPALAADNVAGKVTYTKGSVSLYQTGRSAPTPLGKGDPVFAGDEIETGKNAAITVTFADDSMLSVGQNGKIVVDQYKMDGKTAKTVRLNTGNGTFEWRGAENGVRDIEITTDSGTVAVGGAHVIRAMQGAETTVYVQNGSATVKTSGGKADVAAGHGTTIAAKGAKPADAAPMTAEQIAWIRAELPAPATPWEAQAAAPAPAAPEQAAPEQPAPPMDVPPVSAAPAAEPMPGGLPESQPESLPAATPETAPVNGAAAPAVAEPAPAMPMEPAPAPAPVPVDPDANPQAAVVTPAPAPVPTVAAPPAPAPEPAQEQAPLPALPPLQPLTP